MGKYLDLWDVSEGHPVARKELEGLKRIVAAAVALVNNPSYCGICDEKVELERALKEAGEKVG